MTLIFTTGRTGKRQNLPEDCQAHGRTKQKEICRVCTASQVVPDHGETKKLDLQPTAKK